MTNFLYIVIITLVIIMIAAFIKLYLFKRNNYKPNNGDIYEGKITVALTDFVFESHDSKTELGTIGDFINCSFNDAKLEVALPYEAISKTGRFLVKLTENNITQRLWVEPTITNKNYTLEAKKIDRFENVSSSK